MKSLRIEIEDDLHKQLRRAALDQDTTISEIVRTRLSATPLAAHKGAPSPISTGTPSPQKTSASLVVPPEVLEEFKPKETRLEKFERDEREARARRTGGRL